MISYAYADSINAPPSAQGGGFSFIMMFLIFFIFIYFGIWRPQNKRAKEQQTLLGSLEKGDEVVTAGGVLGRISKINDKYLIISIANNVDITISKTSVSNVLPKGTLKSITS